LTNKICYFLDPYWALDNIFAMLANDDVLHQWLTEYLEDPSHLWFNIAHARELELNLDSFGCLDGDL